MTNHIIYQKASEMTNQKYFNALVRGRTRFGVRGGAGGPGSPRKTDRRKAAHRVSEDK